jgi:YihY family inner membrane protein
MNRARNTADDQSRLPSSPEPVRKVARWLTRAAARPRSPAQTLGILELAARAGHRVEITRMAAALTYRTIFSIIPVLVIALVFLGALASDSEIRSVVGRTLAYTGLSEIVLDEAPSEVAAEELEGAETSSDPRDAEFQPTPLDPEPTARSQRLDEWITALVTRVRGINFGAIGVIGFLTLIYAAISMVVEMEQCFNTICRAPAGKGWIRRIIQYWALLTLGALALFVSFTVSEVFQQWVEHLSLFQGFDGVRQTLLWLVGFGVTVMISTTVLMVLYITVPNTRVSLGPAIIGSVLAAIAWELGKWGFTRYIHYSASYSRFYGSIALIPLFMLWVYVTWIILLTGLQLAYAIQTFRQGKELAQLGDTHGLLALIGFLGPDRYIPPEPALVDPASILAVATTLAVRHNTGQATSASDAGSSTGIDERIVVEMLDRMTEVGLVHRVEGRAGTRQYAPARPPSSISAEEVLRIGQAMSPGPRTAEHAQMLTALVEARLDAVRGKSLADIAGTFNTPLPAGTAGAKPETPAGSPQSEAPPTPAKLAHGA